MKKRGANRVLVLLLSVAVLGVLFCGCAKEDMAVDMEYGNGAYAEEMYSLEMGYEAEEPELSAAGSVDGNVAENRKLIRRLSLSVETENYDDLLGRIQERVTAVGGYMEQLEANTRYGTKNRYADMTLRIPANQLSAFSEHMEEISNVVWRSESTEDVTTQYVDTETHLAALRIEQERLMALLEKAETLTDILELESRMTDVRYELERMESQLRTYDNQIEYATVSLSVAEVEAYTPIEEPGFWESIGDGFVDSMHGVWSFLTGAFAVFVVAIPYIVLLGVILSVVLLPIIAHRRKKKKVALSRIDHPEE